MLPQTFAGSRQLSFFDLSSEGAVANAPASSGEAEVQPTVSPRPKQKRTQRHESSQGAIRTVAIGDLPHYPPELVEQVDRSVADLPPDKLWFNYRDLQRCFGVSRATIARRMKDGLVPSIRMLGDRVLDDGAVRRFDRIQVRWLLLSVKRSCQLDLIPASGR